MKKPIFHVFHDPSVNRSELIFLSIFLGSIKKNLKALIKTQGLVLGRKFDGGGAHLAVSALKTCRHAVRNFGPNHRKFRLTIILSFFITPQTIITCDTGGAKNQSGQKFLDSKVLWSLLVS